MNASNHLFNKCDKKIRQVNNQIITHQIPEEKVKQLGCEIAALHFKMIGACCTWRAPGPEHITVSL